MPIANANCISPAPDTSIFATYPHIDNFSTPSDPFVIHVEDTPVSVQFSRYKSPIPYLALISTYRQIWNEAHSRGSSRIFSSQKWEFGATVNLWPKYGMTWEMFAFSLQAMGEFTRKQGLEGFRFDVYYNDELKGLGAVSARTTWHTKS